MRGWVPCAALVTAVLLYVPAAGCSHNNGPAEPKIVATETWTVDIGTGQAGGELTFIKRANGVVTAVGEWIFGEIDCPFSAGPGAVSDSTISFMATGIATDNTVSSAFTLTVDGTAAGGVASGTYSIVFSQGWTTSAPSNWIGALTNGSGITP